MAVDISRPVPWVSPVLYGAVLIAGLYAGLTGLGDTHMVLFAGGMAALFALEFVHHQLFLLIARAALFIVVALADGSGLSRALFVLLPFTAYFAFGRTVSIVLGIACLGLVIAAYEWATPGWMTNLEQVSDLLMFGLGLVLAIAMAAVAVEERKSRKRLEESHRQIAQLSAAAERNRVAHDLHDDLGHHLTAVVVLLEKATAFRDRDPDAAERALDDAAQSARRALEDVRQSVRTLRSDPEPFRLSAALKELVNGSIPFEITGDEGRYDQPVLMALYRAAQEGITNARRHARATEIGVTVWLGDAEARLTVADNGSGFSPDREGFGLRGIRERVQLVGGSLSVQSRGSTGTRLMVVVPRQQGAT